MQLYNLINALVISIHSREILINAFSIDDHDRVGDDDNDNNSSETITVLKMSALK